MGAVYLLTLSNFTLGRDFSAYYTAAQSVLNGGSMYGHNPPYLYLPVTILLFSPFAVLPFNIAYAGMWIVNLVAIGLIAGLSISTLIREIDIHLTRRDYLVIVTFSALSIHSVPNLLQGQVNLLIGAGVAVLGASIFRTKSISGGVALSLIWVLKIIPGVIGIYALWQRRWRMAVFAIASGILTVVTSLLLFDIDEHRRYVDILLSRRSTDALIGGLDPTVSFVTLRQPLSYVFPQSPTVVTIVSLLILSAVVSAVYIYSGEGEERIIAYFSTVLAVILAFASYYIYLAYALYPLVVTAYILEESRGHTVFVMGLAILALSLNLKNILVVINAAPVPNGVSNSLLTVIQPLLSIVSLPLFGSILCLVGCVYSVTATPKQTFSDG
jgi:hypothetical protein